MKESLTGTALLSDSLIIAWRIMSIAATHMSSGPISFGFRLCGFAAGEVADDQSSRGSGKLTAVFGHHHRATE